jgi:hypothetical protein
MNSIASRAAFVLAAWAALAAHAQAPRQPAVWGFAPGISPAAAAAKLAAEYANCRTEQTTYRRAAGLPPGLIASLAINPGLAHHDLASPDFCQDSPAGAGITDTVELRFAHPEVDPGQALYRIEVKRVYPDAVFAADKRVAHSFERLRASLLREYGKARDERREKTASASANLAASLGVGRAVRREDFVARHLWAMQVDWFQEFELPPAAIAAASTSRRRSR